MKRVLVFLTLIVSTSAQCAQGWSQRGKITEVYTQGHFVRVKLSNGMIDYSNGACPDTSYYAMSNENQIKFDAIFSQILTAHTAGLDVVFWINGNKCIGSNNAYQDISSIKTFK